MRLFLISLSVLSLVFGTIINIPDDYSTIQEGINASIDGDTVLVQPGEYFENVNFLDREIVLTSQHMFNPLQSLIDNTIIDGSLAEERVVQISDFNGPGTVLHGFTIRGGQGGVLASNWSQPSLEFLVVRDNYLLQGIYNYGSGIHVSSAPGTRISNSEIAYNICNTYECSGGGISVNNSDMTIEDVYIHHNNVNEGVGGGIRIGNSSDVFLINVLIEHNSCIGAGGGLYHHSAYVNLAGVTIRHNYANQGGGIYYNVGSMIGDYSNRPSVYLNSGIQGRDFYAYQPLSLAVDTATVAIPTAYHAWPVENWTLLVNAGLLEQHASDLYVSPNGDDTNSGTTWEEPLRTVDRALCTIIPGDLSPHIINLEAGYHIASETGESYPLGWISGVSLFGEDSDTTILDAEQSGRFFTVKGVENASFQMMTLQNGWADKGGAMSVQNSDISIDDVIFVNNIADDDGGSAISSNNSAIQMTDVIMANNTAVDGGDALWIWGGEVSCFNCILRQNQGGGIFNHGGTQLYIGNSILWDNTPHQLHTVQSGSSVTIEYSDIQGGPDYIQGFNEHVDWDTSNINSNPHFCISDNYLHVAENSPCLGSGIAGQNMGQVIIACDALPEYDSTIYFISATGNDLLGDGSELSPFETFANTIAHAVDGDTIVVEPGIYFDTVNFQQKELLISSRIIEGYDESIVLNTILDGSGNPGAPLLNLTGDYSELTRFEGFTLQNALGSDETGTCIPGAIIIGGSATPQLSRLWILNNPSTCFYPVGAVLVQDTASPVMERVIFAGNIAEADAGALTVKNQASALLNHVTMNQNTSLAPAISVSNSAALEIVNSIIQDSISVSVGATLDASYSNFQHWVPGPGNHSADPLFEDPENLNFHLLAESPCINGGDPDLPLDVDGSIADMGYYVYGEDDDLFLSFGGYDPETGVLPILITTSEYISGFQITFSGIVIAGAWGGMAQAAGFMISSNDNFVLGFAMMYIHPGSGVLFNLDIESFTGDPLCFEDVLISGSGGTQLEVAHSPCINLTECDLFGDLNQDGVLDILDIVAQVNCILDDQECYCGDLNGDAVVNIQDILLLVSLIMWD